MAKPFIKLGNWQYQVSMMINRKLFRVETDTDMFVKPLNVEIALETGMELFYEIAVYAFVLVICIYEIRKYTIEGQISKEKVRANFERIEKKLDSCIDKQKTQETQLEDIRKLVINANRTALLNNYPTVRLLLQNENYSRFPNNIQS